MSVVESKACRKCKQELPLCDFYRHNQMLDGHLNICKVCTRLRVASHREKNIEQIRQYDRKRGLSSERKERARKYARANRDKHNEASRAWAGRNPEKRAAHIAVGNAVRDGRLIKGRCECCGENRVQAHHDDYSRPLDVRWLCSGCHGKEHRRYG